MWLPVEGSVRQPGDDEKIASQANSVVARDGWSTHTVSESYPMKQ
jgi:hypothetical protein